MATSPGTIEFLMDQLRDIEGVRSRKMFGEYALYVGDKVVGLVCDDRLFMKITPEGTAWVGSGYEEGLPYPGAKPALLVSADDLDDPERLCELVRITAAALPTPSPKKPRPRRGRAAT